MRASRRTLAVALTAFVLGCGDGPEREDDTVSDSSISREDTTGVQEQFCDCNTVGFLIIRTSEGGWFECEERRWNWVPQGVSIRLCLDYEGELTFHTDGAADFMSQGVGGREVYFDFGSNGTEPDVHGVTEFRVEGPRIITVHNNWRNYRNNE